MRRIKIPTSFKTQKEEIEFWKNLKPSDYPSMTDDELERLLKLKPSTETISLRLPLWLLTELKEQANKRGIPYQSYIKILLAEYFIRS